MSDETEQNDQIALFMEISGKNEFEEINVKEKEKKHHHQLLLTANVNV